MRFYFCISYKILFLIYTFLENKQDIKVFLTFLFDSEFNLHLYNFSRLLVRDFKRNCPIEEKRASNPYGFGCHKM